MSTDAPTDLAELREALRAIVDEMEDDESIGIPPNVPLLIEALRSLVVDTDFDA